jgi:hypothetical protein
MKRLRSFETSGTTHQAVQGHISADPNSVLDFSWYFSHLQTNVVKVRKVEPAPIFLNLSQIIQYAVFFKQILALLNNNRGNTRINVTLRRVFVTIFAAEMQ